MAAFVVVLVVTVEMMFSLSVPTLSLVTPSLPDRIFPSSARGCSPEGWLDWLVG